MRHFLALQLLLCLLASGCVDSPADHSGKTAAAEKKAAKADGLEVSSVPLIAGEAKVEMSPKGKISLEPAMQRLVEQAKEDLATRISVDVQDIKTLRAENVTWRDSSMGCPEPGNQYMQVLTNGSRITLVAKKQIYHYHSGGNRPPFLCAKPSPNDPVPYAPGET